MVSASMPETGYQLSFQTAQGEGEASDTVQVTSGVPQGSVLGLILFLIYINDLPNEISSGVRLFADDAIVHQTISDPSDCQTLQEDLDELSNWEKT